jgi:hypothetical protein
MAAAHRRRHTREASRVCLLTSRGPDGHTHVATFNAAGDGQTDEASDGHWHRVRGLEVQPFNGHRHEITSERAPGDEVAAEVSPRRAASRVG